MLPIIKFEAGVFVEERVSPAAKESSLLDNGYVVTGSDKFCGSRKTCEAAADDDYFFQLKSSFTYGFTRTYNLMLTQVFMAIYIFCNFESCGGLE